MFRLRLRLSLLLLGHAFFIRGSTNAAPSLLRSCEARAMPLRRESRSPRVSRIREAACLPLHALIRKAPFLLCAQNVHTTAATKAGPPASPSSARSTTPRPSATCSASPLAPSSPSSPLCSLRGCSSTLEVSISPVLCLAACETVTSGTPHWRARCHQSDDALQMRPFSPPAGSRCSRSCSSTGFPRPTPPRRTRQTLGTLSLAQRLPSAPSAP